MTTKAETKTLRIRYLLSRDVAEAARADRLGDVLEHLPAAMAAMGLEPTSSEIETVIEMAAERIRQATDFERRTLGTWADSSGRRLTASYHDAGTVRVDRSDASSDVYTWREWMRLCELIRDAGFRRAA